MKYNEAFSAILNQVAEDKRRRAKEARINLINVLLIEMKGIPDAVVILERYAKWHGTDMVEHLHKKVP